MLQFFNFLRLSFILTLKVLWKHWGTYKLILCLWHFATLKEKWAVIFIYLLLSMAELHMLANSLFLLPKTFSKENFGTLTENALFMALILVGTLSWSALVKVTEAQNQSIFPDRIFFVFINSNDEFEFTTVPFLVWEKYKLMLHTIAILNWTCTTRVNENFQNRANW